MTLSTFDRLPYHEQLRIAREWEQRTQRNRVGWIASSDHDIIQKYRGSFTAPSNDK